MMHHPCELNAWRTTLTPCLYDVQAARQSEASSTGKLPSAEAAVTATQAQTEKDELEAPLKQPEVDPNEAPATTLEPSIEAQAKAVGAPAADTKVQSTAVEEFVKVRRDACTQHARAHTAVIAIAVIEAG